MTTKPDPTIERIRQARHQISKRFEHDPRKILDHYRRMEEQYADRVMKDSSSRPA